MNDDSTKPVGYDTLREALAAIIEYEQTKRHFAPHQTGRDAQCAHPRPSLGRWGA